MSRSDTRADILLTLGGIIALAGVLVALAGQITRARLGQCCGGELTWWGMIVFWLGMLAVFTGEMRRRRRRARDRSTQP